MHWRLVMAERSRLDFELFARLIHEVPHESTYGLPSEQGQKWLGNLRKQLYDSQNDSGEENKLLCEHAEIASQLIDLLNKTANEEAHSLNLR